MAQKQKSRAGSAAPKKLPRTAWKKGQRVPGAGSPKQIFGTRDPFKQAVIRVALIEQDMSLTASQKAQKKAATLDKAARRLLVDACDPKKGIRAVEILRDTLDGKPQANEPPVQINTFHMVLNSLRALDLTEEQLDALTIDADPTDAGAGGVIPQT